MENVLFEKQQLLSLWKSNLLYLQQKDDALQKTEARLEAQTQLSSELANENAATLGHIAKEQEVQEQTTALLDKIRTDACTTNEKIAESAAKRTDLRKELDAVEGSIRDVDERLLQAQREAENIEAAAEASRKGYVKVCRETQELQDAVLSALHEQNTTERSASKTIGDLRKNAKEKQKNEVAAVELKNDLAKLEVDILNTERHNVQLRETRTALEAELEERVATVGQLEAEEKKRESEIDKQTRELDALNRRYQQLAAAMEEETSGPLEATVHNLQREIQNKAAESQELQRKWMQQQLELVELENQNNALVESLALTQSKTTVMQQKRRRLEDQLAQNLSAVKTLRTSMGRLHKDIQSLNGVIAKNAALSSALETQTFAIEADVAAELKELQSASSKIERSLRDTSDEKRDILEEMVRVEKQILAWERRLELEREMQAALTPEVGQDEAQAMRKEIHRMELALNDLHRRQEHLVREMEVAVHKRQNIRRKGEAMKSRDGTTAQLEKVCQDLQRNIRGTNREVAATADRILALQSDRAALTTDLETRRIQCETERGRLNETENKLTEACLRRSEALMKTLVFQRIAKKLQDVADGRARPPRQGALPEDVQKAQRKAATIREVCAAKTAASEPLQLAVAQLDAINGYNEFNEI